MPEICRFFGIIITVYYDDHPPPHFHARYGNQRARFAIEDLRMIDGNIQSRVRGLVVEWASLHQDELGREWELAREQLPLFPIAPLQ